MKNLKTKDDILKYIILAIIYILIILLIIELFRLKKNTTADNNIDTDITTTNTAETTTTTTFEKQVVTDMLTKDNYEIEYSYERISNTLNNNLKFKINEKEIDLSSYDTSKEKFRKIDIQLKKDYFIVELANENACKTPTYNLTIIDYTGKVLFTLEPKDNDINFSRLKYDGNYIYNENKNSIELNYIISCDMTCNICSSLDSQKNPLKDINRMTCDELDYIVNNTSGKKITKLTYENNQIIETQTSSEKLIDDTSGYNNNIKNKLTDFYKSKCSNE